MATPATITATPEADQRSVQKLVQRQRAFFASGKTLDVEFRREQLKRLQQAIRKHEQDLFDAMYSDFRKPEMETYSTEVGFVELELKLTLKNLTNWAKPRKVSESIINFPASSYVYSEPYGVALIIGPWNYPFQLLLNPLIGAMAAGNCAVVKPSELTPATSAVVARMLRENFEEDYVAVVEGGVQTTQYLLQQRYDYIFFTGSTRVGKIVMRAAAENLTPVTLELGGKSPAIVAEDADLGLAARRIAWGKYLNAGQTCVAPDYVLVEEQVKEEFVHLLSQTIQDFYGEDPAKSPDYARIVNDQHFSRLSKLLQDGVTRTGGQTDGNSRYIAPTVLDQVTWQHPVMQDEIFGPILPVIPFKGIDEAVKMVNNHEKPLALYFFSSSKSKQQQLLQYTHFGGGCINDTISHLINPNLPFGGVGASGMGSYHGKGSFDVFSHQKSVLHRGTWIDLPLRYPPYRNRLPMLRKLFNWL
ncbi:aldehyde dehydrogenase [Pontibacter akesuensis]|uniref:Aldehyde dehydrogenase n=1 Tax=Pontibacter akesuensis TaxID=388950 RepID=A0A1I7GTY2_9BACT|nr:aldehyde dehydrogenase [Pontibacter akesuensis]GHA55076.1 aldehyde dehydrogenase [Pontibacter akesuensis]SFU51923.1 aldehyde dehydrogenase (NAD+) [Pontibacter akesuensis]